MPTVNYYQQSAPFWDFIANMEQQGSSHPLFAGLANRGEDEHNNNHDDTTWQGGWGGFPFGGTFAHRPRPDHPHHHHRHPHGPPSDNEGTPEKEKEREHDPEEGSSEPHGPPPPFSEKPDHPAGPHHRGPGAHRGRCGGARGRGGWGGRGWGGPWGGRRGKGPMNHPLAEFFQQQFFGENESTKETTDENFKPEADVFDTTESFVIHVSLPGAKKEDVGVNWDPEHSELSIAGVIYRPGDEELLKTLALDERKVGAFERKVRLGSRANPAQVDVDAITAKMEDGVLRVDVPKLDSGYVEIKKVDIE